MGHARSVLVAGAVCGLALAACGGGTTTPNTTGTTAGPAPTASTPTSVPGASGTLAAISGSTLEVQNPTSGQVSVILDKTTVISQTVPATAAQVVVGACVSVTGTRATSGTLDASTVAIIKSGATGCTRAGPNGAGGFLGSNAGAFRRRTTGSTTTKPPVSFGSASGKVTTTSKASFVVQGTRRVSATATATVVSTTVDETTSTTYVELTTGSAAALKVGDCVTAIGSTNSIGAVTARQLSVRPAGPGGCTTGFGGGRGFFRGAGGAVGAQRSSGG